MTTKQKRASIDISDVALAGSALGNIISIFELAKKEDNINILKQELDKAVKDKNYLISMLEIWKSKSNMLNEEVKVLKENINQLQQQINRQQQTIYEFQGKQFEKTAGKEKLK
jgi:predicted nuclease with TOPRIM domain